MNERSSNHVNTTIGQIYGIVISVRALGLRVKFDMKYACLSALVDPSSSSVEATTISCRVVLATVLVLWVGPCEIGLKFGIAHNSGITHILGIKLTKRCGHQISCQQPQLILSTSNYEFNQIDSFLSSQCKYNMPPS